jgi:hypothetical protein
MQGFNIEKKAERKKWKTKREKKTNERHVFSYPTSWHFKIERCKTTEILGILHLFQWTNLNEHFEFYFYNLE